MRLLWIIAAACGGSAYAYLLLRAWRGLGRLHHKSGDSLQHFPTASVVVSARDEEANAAELVRSLRGLDYPPDCIEFVIVDDHSSDRTGEAIRQAAEGDARFRVLPSPDSGGTVSSKKLALQTGISASSGEVILFTDADCRPPSGWARALTAPFAEGVAMVAGQARFTLPATSPLWQRLQALDFKAQSYTAAGLTADGMPFTCTSASLAFTRDLWDSVGGWEGVDRLVSGDDELLMVKAVQRGYKTAACGELSGIVPTMPPASLAELWHQRARWGSKGLYYEPRRRLILGGVLLFLLTLAASPLALVGGAVVPVAAAWLAKLALDLMVLLRGGRLFKERLHWREFWLLFPFYPMLIVVIVLAGHFGKFRWKGRSYRSRSRL